MTERIVVFVDAGYLHNEVKTAVGLELDRLGASEATIARWWEEHFQRFKRSGWPSASRFNETGSLPDSLRRGVRKGNLSLEKAKAAAYRGSEDLVVGDCFDYSSFIQELAGSSTLLRAIVYSAARPGRGTTPFLRWSTEEFHKKLDWESDIGVRLGIMARHDGGWTQKGVDVQLAVDLVRMAARSTYDRALLLTADNDFVPAVCAVLDLGPCIDVVTVGATRKRETLDVARRADRHQHLGNADLLRFIKIDGTTPLPGPTSNQREGDER